MGRRRVRALASSFSFPLFLPRTPCERPSLPGITRCTTPRPTSSAGREPGAMTRRPRWGILLAALLTSVLLMGVFDIAGQAPETSPVVGPDLDPAMRVERPHPPAADPEATHPEEASEQPSSSEPPSPTPTATPRPNTAPAPTSASPEAPAPQLGGAAPTPTQVVGPAPTVAPGPSSQPTPGTPPPAASSQQPSAPSPPVQAMPPAELPRSASPLLPQRGATASPPSLEGSGAEKRAPVERDA